MIKLFLKELFYALTAALLIFTTFELLRPNLILGYFNLNYLLIFWIIIGIVLLILADADNTKEKIDGQK